MPNFTALDMSLPEVATLVSAMVQARDAVSRRSWSHQQEPTGEEWWADVLADPRARKREPRTDLAVNKRFMGSPTKGARSYLWRAASAIGELRFRATTSSPLMVQTTRCPTYSTISPHRVAAGSALIGIGAACIMSSPSKEFDSARAGTGSLLDIIEAIAGKCRWPPSAKVSAKPAYSSLCLP